MTVIDKAFLACLLVAERKRQLAVKCSVEQTVERQEPVSQHSQHKEHASDRAILLLWVDPGEISDGHLNMNMYVHMVVIVQSWR